MNWEAIGAIAELIGAGGVVAKSRPMAAPGTRAWWDGARLAYSTPFRTFLERTGS